MSRGLAFWNDETIALIRERFVAAAVPTWVCRSDTPEGEFLRAAGVDRQWVTSSGYMTCLSASGTLLGRQPTPEVVRAFEALPEAERRPGAVQVRKLQPSERAVPAPPDGGLVLRVHARFLGLGDDGRLRAATVADFPLMRATPDSGRSWRLFLQPNTEYMWLTRDEWRALVPDDPAPGQRVEAGADVVLRMARFHLTPKRATTSEGGTVDARAVKAARMTLVVEEATPARIRMGVEGFVRWGSDYDEAKATSPDGPLAMGFETRLEGRLVYDREKRIFERFDLVAPGHVWGRWGDANGKSMVVERPGRAPFGFSFELAGDSPTDRLPPGGNGRTVSEATGYFGAR
ncbi:MAG TPA: hypothetical protein VEJ18_03750 [Planctomycetota bacterium]|nr:hypothetical protein [Planctomycetota bacterium]